MRTNGQAMKGHEMVTPHVELESVRAWAKRIFTKERLQEAALCVATVGVIGTVLFSLHRAMENFVIVGF